MSAYRKEYSKKNKDNLRVWKREKYDKNYRRTVKGYLTSIWNSLNQRCGKGPYKEISLEMTKEQWRDFATPLLEKFLQERPHETPSLDRINPNGNYSLDNIQIISYQENLLRSRFNLARFGIDENSRLDDRLELITKMFIGNCEALQVSTESAFAYLSSKHSSLIV